ncbi:MAG: hypothetical protein L0154_29185 [Chloroflexi bacterium]|nr:hypothetical protein [Chloroflexota bacterium]
MLLKSAELLDALPNKVIGKTYHEDESLGNLDSMLPEYFVDAFRYAQEQDANLLTDDGMLLSAYKHFGEEHIPNHFSSFSLVKALTINKLLSWESYLYFFALLSGYRYHLLPISVDDMMHTVFPVSDGGLVTVAPRKLEYLNLPITLSNTYGVDKKTVVGILSTFFNKIIYDHSIPQELADEIFAITIVQGLMGRENRILARAIFQICNQTFREKELVHRSSENKLRILGNQLDGFAQGVDPIIVESAFLLRGTDSKTHITNG